MPLRRADHSSKVVLPCVKIHYETSGVRRPISLQGLYSHVMMIMGIRVLSLIRGSISSTFALKGLTITTNNLRIARVVLSNVTLLSPPPHIGVFNPCIIISETLIAKHKYTAQSSFSRPCQITTVSFLPPFSATSARPPSSGVSGPCSWGGTPHVAGT
jgi:hypothetical protein